MTKTSFWDLDFETFKKTKKDIDTQIAELIADIEKQEPQFADDVIDRVHAFRQIQGALDTLGDKLAALQRYGIQALSDQDKLTVVNALEGVKNLLALTKKLAREEVPVDGSLARHVWGQKKRNDQVVDWMD